MHSALGRIDFVHRASLPLPFVELATGERALGKLKAQHFITHSDDGVTQTLNNFPFGRCLNADAAFGCDRIWKAAVIGADNGKPIGERLDYDCRGKIVNAGNNEHVRKLHVL